MGSENNSLPFFSREQLNFSHGLTFKLRLVTQCSYVGQITISGATKEGKFSYKQTTTADGQPTQTDFAISDFPIFLSVIDSQGTFIQGRCRATVTLLLDGDPMLVMCSGLVSNRKSISYPQTEMNDFIPGGGELIIVDSANPAAGAELSYTAGNFFVYRLIAANITLVTSATVANRRVHVTMGDSFDNRIDFPSPVDQPASTTYKYTIAASSHQQSAIIGNDIVIPIPDNILIFDGDFLSTATDNKQAGDDFGVAEIWMERYFV